MADAQPKCPECESTNIRVKEIVMSAVRLICCDDCGHIIGVSPKRKDEYGG